MSRPAKVLALAYRRAFSVRNFAALGLVPLMAAAVHFATVRPGDTLSGIAQRACHGQAADWTGIWSASRARHLIGANPDLIYPGQKVVISCKTASVPTAAADTASRPVTSSKDADGDFDNDSTDAASNGAVYSSPKSSTVNVQPQQNFSGGGHLSIGGLEVLWEDAGGPAWAAPRAAEIAWCESGGNEYATNPSSGAAGYWQILGQVVGGNIYDPMVNAENAVAKFRASGDTFAQWVCQ